MAGTGRVNAESNAMVVVNEAHVVVVDSQIAPDAARALIESVMAVNDKPIRYLINNHFHFDHAHINQAYPEGNIGPAAKEAAGHEEKLR